MPVRKVSGGWKVDGTPTVHKTKEKAEEQMRAIYAAKSRSEKKKEY